MWDPCEPLVAARSASNRGGGPGTTTTSAVAVAVTGAEASLAMVAMAVLVSEAALLALNLSNHLRMLEYDRQRSSLLALAAQVVE